MENQTIVNPASIPSPDVVSPAKKPESNVGVLDEFQAELISFWRQLPNKAFFFTLLFAWLALFQFRGNSILGYVHTHSLFAWMYEAYNTQNTAAADDQIGNFIPFLVIGLLWVKRKQLLKTEPRLWLPGIAIVLLAMVFHAAGYVIQEPRVSIMALFTGIYGLMALAWGWKWIVNSFFPYFLFIFSIPLGNHSDIITTRLQLLVCWLVELVSHQVLGIDIIRSGAQLFDPQGTYAYEVAAACSGIRSLFTILLLAIVYGFLTYQVFWKRLFVSALAIPFAVLGNLIRMMFIIIAANYFGKEWGDWAHENSIVSMIPYVPAILGLLWVGSWLENGKDKRSHENA